MNAKRMADSVLAALRSCFFSMFFFFGFLAAFLAAVAYRKQRTISVRKKKRETVPAFITRMIAPKRDPGVTTPYWGRDPRVGETN